MYRSIRRKISDSYRKNRDDFTALIFGIYPEFVYRSIKELPRGEIPVFTFHSIEPEYFESQLRFLGENNYRTINSDEFYDIIICKKQPEQNTVVLTFDDGLRSLWSTAYPLLKKYGLRAISFIVPFCVNRESECYPNIEDVWLDKISEQDLEKLQLNTPICTWNEIETMHKSGIIDFQSHTSYHHSVFISDRLVDFINPKLQPSFLCSALNPVVRINGEDVFLHNGDWGRPIYEWGASMSASTRYVEDELVSQACIDYVKQNGGIAFFAGSRWYTKLKRFKEDFEKRFGKSDCFQSYDERFSEVYRDLIESKKMIEQKLDTSVRHLCFPWYEGSELAIQTSKDAGYLSNYWGILHGKAINKVGSDPYYIVRINDDYILTLPGKDRIQLHRLLMGKAIRMMDRKRKKAGSSE